MELRQIQYFICLYEEGTVTRAARRLNIVQPALSMQIARLEDEIGRKLFERSQQGMRPTSAARQMYRTFLPIMRDFTHARDQLLRTDGELKGHVNIGMIASIAQGVLSDAIEEFAAQHAQVTITVTDGYSATLGDLVAGGQLDAAFINKPRRPLSLAVEHIVDEDLVLVTGSRHAHDLGPTVPLRTAAQLDLALPTRQHGLRGILESFAQAEDIDLSPTYEMDSIVSIIKLVENTAYATLLPRVAVRNRVQRGRLRLHEVSDPQLFRQVVCVTHPRRALTAEAAAFVEVMTRHVRGLAAPIKQPKAQRGAALGETLTQR
ncbi:MULTISPECIES: LysR family transcriptional regulator [unclassified Achromobacter]|uniref:LysR family transcriptional regulator n=1 Tax=unclassified Achromobacter TaxID=2626865 RepID=UPI000B51C5F7|nr:MULTISPECIES: LysR family transcriptional regulator [unclassified Achromobacter]OWT80051.1 LysR family transcriptional regulator [Achromobacter sp. HZ34]OWT81934.1 LysR family transcriptional regulator [Achromobacter sp. HZ28]